MEYIISVLIAVFLTLIILMCIKKFKNKVIFILIVWLITIAMLLFLFIENPIINIIGNNNISVQVFSNYNDEGATAFYHFKDISQNIRSYSDIDTTEIGKYKVTYSITAGNNTSTTERIVNVVDDVPPTIKLSGDEKVFSSSLELYNEPGYTVEDNYDKDLNEKIIIKDELESENLYKKIYSVEDSSGNKAQAIRLVEIKDVVSPAISLKGANKITVYKGNKYNEQGATAVDDLDGDITGNIIISGSVNTNKKGSYNITYSVKDKSGNETSVVRTINVIEKATYTPSSSVDTSSGKGVIYLTFDDGPSSSITPKILDILKEENVRATFFILNYSAGTEYLVKRIVNEGHSIGIHGYSHDYKTIYKSEEAYMNNLTSLRNKIKKSTGVDTTITRFPGGSSNTVSRFNPGIMTRLTKKVVAEGYRYYDWNVSSGDAGGATNSQDVYRNVTNGLKKNRNNVVLMHDFSGNTKTLNALRDIIKFGKNNGYTFNKITTSTPMVTHGVNN